MTTKQTPQPNIKQSFKPVTRTKFPQTNSNTLPVETNSPLIKSNKIMESPENNTKGIFTQQTLYTQFPDKNSNFLQNIAQGENSISNAFFNQNNPKDQFKNFPFSINSQQINGFNSTNQHDLEQIQNQFLMPNNMGTDDYFGNSRSIRINEKQEENQSMNIFEHQEFRSKQLINNNLAPPNQFINPNSNSNNFSKLNMKLKNLTEFQNIKSEFTNQDIKESNTKQIEQSFPQKDRSLTFRGSNKNSQNNYSNTNSTQSSVKNKQSLQSQFPHTQQNTEQQQQNQKLFQKNNGQLFDIINNKTDPKNLITNFDYKINHTTNNEEEEEDENKKNTRGLRYLSLQVKEIVCDKKKTTYKEVADTLVENLKQMNTHSGMSQNEILKDEQNIKRRVYDALNVLIASEVIQKKGKSVTSFENSFLKGRCLQKDNWKIVKQKQKQLQEKQNVIQQKQRIIKDYVQKTLALKSLINRNKEYQQIYQEYKNNKDFKAPSHVNEKELSQIIENESNPNEKFNFPITQLSFQPEEDSMVLKMSKSKKDLKFFSKKPVYIYGDLDILTNFNFHKVSTSFMEENMHDDILKKYYNQEYNQSKQIELIQTQKSKIQDSEQQNSTPQQSIKQNQTPQQTQQLQKQKSQQPKNNDLNKKRPAQQEIQQKTVKKTNKKVKK